MTEQVQLALVGVLTEIVRGLPALAAAYFAYRAATSARAADDTLKAASVTTVDGGGRTRVAIRAAREDGATQP